MKDSFWTELLDLCRKHGVTELYSTNPDKPARLTLAYDEVSGAGDFIISDLAVKTSKPDHVPLKGTHLLYVYIDNVRVELVEEISLRGMLRTWTSKFSKRIGLSS